jgi:hypothetical protein
MTKNSIAKANQLVDKHYCYYCSRYLDGVKNAIITIRSIKYERIFLCDDCHYTLSYYYPYPYKKSKTFFDYVASF